MGHSSDLPSTIRRCVACNAILSAYNQQDACSVCTDRINGLPIVDIDPRDWQDPVTDVLAQICTDLKLRERARLARRAW